MKQMPFYANKTDDVKFLRNVVIFYLHKNMLKFQKILNCKFLLFTSRLEALACKGSVTDRRENFVSLSLSAFIFLHQLWSGT
jgi:hypothetical protein